MIAAFAALFAALYAAHQVADHWVQTQHQADHKGGPGWPGRWACIRHCATYGLTQLAAIGALVVLLDLPVSAGPLTAGMTVNLGSHYLADRRAPLRWLADRLGKDPGWLERGGGLYALDQSWHVGWLFVSALVIAV